MLGETRNVVLTQLEDGRWVAFECGGPNTAHYYVSFSQNVRQFKDALDLLVAETGMQFDAVYENQVVFIEINYTKLNTDQIPQPRNQKGINSYV